jgi:hypothetical protein
MVRRVAASARSCRTDRASGSRGVVVRAVSAESVRVVIRVSVRVRAPVSRMIVRSRVTPASSRSGSPSRVSMVDRPVASAAANAAAIRYVRLP